MVEPTPITQNNEAFNILSHTAPGTITLCSK